LDERLIGKSLTILAFGLDEINELTLV
jgi:hypothetical protein